jgi:hypothetical protein
MKKAVALVLIGVFMLLAVAPTFAADKGRGGFLGFIAGCCFGIRSGCAYNDGKDLHWREWGLLIPLFSIYVGIVNGIDGYNGKTTSDLAAQFGATYY